MASIYHYSEDEECGRSCLAQPPDSEFKTAARLSRCGSGSVRAISWVNVEWVME